MATASTASEEDLKAVCKEIDEVLITFMEKAELYQGSHHKSTEKLKSGYLALTKARLNSGGITMKADLTLQPQTTVSCDYVPGEPADVESEGRYSHRRLMPERNGGAESSNRDASPSTPSRRRVAHEDLRDAPAKSDAGEEGTTPAQADESIPPPSSDKLTKTEVISKPTDPLSAFGFMSRNALKPAQLQFNGALSFLIDTADVVQELLQLQRRYNKLLEKKKTLQSQLSL